LKGGEKIMQENKKPPQVAGTTSEEIENIKINDGNHKRCNFCNKVILKNDNYCCYCGSSNPKGISKIY
jgi:hypothetical protein